MNTTTRLALALLCATLAACTVAAPDTEAETEDVPREADDPTEAPEDVLLPRVVEPDERIPAAEPCVALPYAYPWEPEWQACIDIESNSRPWRCGYDEGPPACPSAFPAREGWWDYEEVETWCCCQTPSCNPN